VDLRSEHDIEQLRLVALAQQVQIERLLRMLRAKCAELAALKGNEKELQQTLALIALYRSTTSNFPRWRPRTRDPKAKASEAVNRGDSGVAHPSLPDRRSAPWLRSNSKPSARLVSGASSHGLLMGE
jgi:hypothetical protein